MHAVTWLVWAVSAAASVQLAPSPVYVVLVVGAAVLAVAAHAQPGPLARAFPALVALGVAFAMVRVVLTTLTTHGVGQAALTLPSFTLPRLLGGFTVGGSVEWEVVLQAAAEGLAIVGLVAAFGAFNAVVSHHELVQAAPRAFFEPGLVLTVALAFVPSTMESLVAVREADRARTGGRTVRRGRLVRQLVPVLERGLERAVLLAESMDVRGYARLAGGRSETVAGVAALLGLLGLGGAFVALVGHSDGVAAALGAAGATGIVAAATIASRGSRRQRYRPRPMTALDVAVLATALLAPVALAVLSATGESTLRWSADPLDVPRFSPIVAVALAPLLAPGLVASPSPTERAPRPRRREVPA